MYLKDMSYTQVQYSEKLVSFFFLLILQDLHVLPSLPLFAQISCELESVQDLNFRLGIQTKIQLSPYWSALDFWKIEFEKSSWMNLIFGLFQTWILQATQAVKIKFEIDQKSSSANLTFQTRFFKDQAQINMGFDHWSKIHLYFFPTFYQKSIFYVKNVWIFLKKISFNNINSRICHIFCKIHFLTTSILNQFLF